MPPRARVAIALLVLLAAPIAPSASAEQAASAVTVGPIVATLAPPFTFYEVAASSSTGAALTYAWSNTNACGVFAGNGPKAQWDHGDTTDCGHDSPIHPGRIRVHVTDGKTNATRHYYDGSASGEGSSPASHPRCEASGVAGAFAPSQGVWQDDDRFPDKVGKKLLQSDPRTYTAELDMVDGRRTALFGVRGSRDTIALAGLLSGTVMAPALVRFTLEDAGGARVLHEHRLAEELPIQGACGDVKGFRAEIPAPLGIPTPAFLFGGTGTYKITMELVEDGGGPVAGTQVVVDGYVREVPGVKVHFLPVVLGPAPAGALASLRTDVDRMAREMREHTTDYYPLEPGKVATSTNTRGIDFSAEHQDALRRCETRRDPANWTQAECAGQVLRTVVERTLAGAAWRGGADRVVAVSSAADFPRYGVSGAQAFTAHTKVIFSRPDSDHWDVAHEVAHTLPRFPWSSAAMVRTCDVDFHNKGVWAAGVQLTSVDQESRARWGPQQGLMGNASADKLYWIEQCTYWHLLRALERPVDPPVLGVVATVERGSAGTTATFEPGYSFDSESDLDANETGAFALVLRDAADAELARYAFDVADATDAGVPLRIVGISHRVPHHPAARSLALEEQGRELARVAVPERAPVVTVEEPADGATVADALSAGVEVRWRVDATAAEQMVLLSTDGASWSPVGVRVAGASFRIPADALVPGATHHVRVVASDGVLSGEDDARFVVPQGARPTPTPTGPTPPSTSPGASGADGAGTATEGTPAPGVLAVLSLAAVVAALLRKRVVG